MTFVVDLNEHACSPYAETWQWNITLKFFFSNAPLKYSISHSFPSINLKNDQLEHSQVPFTSQISK